MALVVRKGKVKRVGDNIVRNYTCAFDASYPTGGEALPASGIGDAWNNAKVRHVNVKPVGANYFLYDKTADKLAAWTSGGEVASTTDLSALTAVKVEVVCIR